MVAKPERCKDGAEVPTSSSLLTVFTCLQEKSSESESEEALEGGETQPAHKQVSKGTAWT